MNLLLGLPLVLVVWGLLLPVLFLDGGVIVEQGPPRDVLDNPQTERLKSFLGRFRQH